MHLYTEAQAGALGPRKLGITFQQTLTSQVEFTHVPPETGQNTVFFRG